MVLTGSGFFGGLLVVLHALLEGLDALRDVRPSNPKFAAAEQQQDDCDHTIQCQMLSEPILLPSKHEWPASRPDLLPKVARKLSKNKDFGHVKRPRQLRLAATVNRHERSRNGRGKISFPGLALRLTRGDSASSRSPASSGSSSSRSSGSSEGVGTVKPVAAANPAVPCLSVPPAPAGRPAPPG